MVNVTQENVNVITDGRVVDVNSYLAILAVKSTVNAGTELACARRVGTGDIARCVSI